MALRTLLIAGATVVAAGCDYLYGSSDLDPDEFGLPKPLATYVTGEATIAIGDEPAFALGNVGSGHLYDSWYGAEATWTNANGWYVRVSGASVGKGMFNFGGSLLLDRIVEGEHWTTFDPGRCIVTIDAADEKSLRGSATCKGLRWSNALAGSGISLEPAYIDGQDPFDAEITFEARPSSTTET